MGLLGDSSVSNNNSNQQSSQSSETNVDTTNTTINTNVTDNSMEMKSTDNSMEKSSIPMVGEMSITDEHKLLPAKTKWKTILSILNNMPLTAIILSTGKGKKMAITGVITAEEVTAAANKLDKHPKKLKIDDVILTNILEILSDVPITKALEMIQNKKPDAVIVRNHDKTKSFAGFFSVDDFQEAKGIVAQQKKRAQQFQQNANTLPIQSEPTGPPITEEEGKNVAQSLGLQLGGNGYAFSGDYSTKGLYAYRSGKYNGMAFFGRGGSVTEMEAPLEEGGSKYRPLPKKVATTTSTNITDNSMEMSSNVNSNAQTSPDPLADLHGEGIIVNFGDSPPPQPKPVIQSSTISCPVCAENIPSSSAVCPICAEPLAIAQPSPPAKTSNFGHNMAPDNSISSTGENTMVEVLKELKKINKNLSLIAKHLLFD